MSSNGISEFGHYYDPAGAETSESVPVDHAESLPAGRTAKNPWPGAEYDSPASGQAPPVPPMIPGGAPLAGGNAMPWPGMMPFQPFGLDWQQPGTAAPGNYHGRHVHDRPGFQGWDPYRFGTGFPGDAMTGQWGLDLHGSGAMQPPPHKRPRSWNETTDRSQSQFRMPGMGPEAYYFGGLPRRPSVPVMPPEATGFVTPFSGLYAEELGTARTPDPMTGADRQSPANQPQNYLAPASRYYYENMPRRGDTGMYNHGSEV